MSQPNIGALEMQPPSGTEPSSNNLLKKLLLGPFAQPRLSAASASRLVAWHEKRNFVDDEARSGAITEESLRLTLDAELRALSEDCDRPVDDLLTWADQAWTRRKAAELNMSVLQRFAGWLSFSNVLWFVAVDAIVAALFALLVVYLQPLIANLGIAQLKALCWAVTLALIAGGLKWGRKTALGVFVSLAGLLAFYACWVFTFHESVFTGDSDSNIDLKPDMHVARVCLVVIWTAVALAHRSTLLGFLDVLALSACLFALAISATEALGLSYTYSSIDQALAVSGIVLVAYVVATVRFENQSYDLLSPSGTQRSSAAGTLALFKDGLYLCGPVLYLLVCVTTAVRFSFFNGDANNPKWKREPLGWFVVRNVLACASCAAFAAVHKLWPTLKRLQQLSGTFFCLYILVRYFDELQSVNTEAAWAWISLGAGGLCFAFACVSKVLPDYFIVHL